MKRTQLIQFLFLSVLIITPIQAVGQIIPKVTVGLEAAKDSKDVAVTLQILFIMTILTLAPSILIMMTSFTRIVVIFSFLRRAIGTQSMPPNQTIIGLSLFLTLFIMMPVITSINDSALQPYLADELDQKTALKKAMHPLREFMLKQTREKDIALFVRMTKLAQPRNVDDLPNTVVIPAFIISELQTSFVIGFLLFIPFLVIDMIVSSVLMSMGMMMLPPVMISMPFKLVLFVLVDGWHLITQQVVASFR